MKPLTFISALLFLVGYVTPLTAQDGKTSSTVDGVVELFTSQGCSSCPAADTLLGKLADRPNVLAMSFSVDYWDYLGWKDTLANHKFTKRQRIYAKARGDGQVYTPQMIVNGSSHVVGSELEAIEKALATKRSINWIPLSIHTDANTVRIEASAGQGAPAATAVAGPGSLKAEMGTATLWLVVMTRKTDITVVRGENAGKTLTYHNVVRDITPVGMWSGEAMSIRLDKKSIDVAGTDLCAVVLQQGHAGPIIGAALLNGY